MEYSWFLMSWVVSKNYQTLLTRLVVICAHLGLADKEIVLDTMIDFFPCRWLILIYRIKPIIFETQNPRLKRAFGKADANIHACLPDEQSYMLRDAEAEVLFCFSLEESLKRAHATPVFKVSITEDIQSLHFITSPL